jgi:periplasmic copper chaperone A
MKTLLIKCLCLGAVAHARAHVTLEQPKAPAGSTYKAVFRIGHGCDGSATHTVRVALPAGFRGAKPMPKAGWTLDVRKAPLAQSYESHGRTVNDDVVEVSWKATPREAWLPDAHYDEFTLRGQLPAAAQPLWFKVQQLCERGEWNWADVPASGTSMRGLKAPAVLLEVTPAETKPHTH